LIATKPWLRRLLQIGAVALVLNEIRGLIAAGPVLYALWLSGSDKLALVAAASSLGGIALTVVIPALLVRRAKRTPAEAGALS
jgi:hypothetical protein